MYIYLLRFCLVSKPIPDSYRGLEESTVLTPTVNSRVFLLHPLRTPVDKKFIYLPFRAAMRLPKVSAPRRLVGIIPQQ